MHNGQNNDPLDQQGWDTDAPIAQRRRGSVNFRKTWVNLGCIFIRFLKSFHNDNMELGAKEYKRSPKICVSKIHDWSQEAQLAKCVTPNPSN